MRSVDRRLGYDVVDGRIETVIPLDNDLERWAFLARALDAGEAHRHLAPQSDQVLIDDGGRGAVQALLGIVAARELRERSWPKPTLDMTVVEPKIHEGEHEGPCSGVERAAGLRPHTSSGPYRYRSGASFSRFIWRP
jgi:hypothetical protein